MVESSVMQWDRNWPFCNWLHPQMQSFIETVVRLDRLYRMLATIPYSLMRKCQTYVDITLNLDIDQFLFRHNIEFKMLRYRADSTMICHNANIILTT